MPVSLSVLFKVITGRFWLPCLGHTTDVCSKQTRLPKWNQRHLSITFFEVPYFLLTFRNYLIQDLLSWKWGLICFFSDHQHTHTHTHTHAFLPLCLFFYREIFTVDQLTVIFLKFWNSEVHQRWRTILLWATGVGEVWSWSLDTHNDKNRMKKPKAPPHALQLLQVLMRWYRPLVVTLQIAFPNRIQPLSSSQGHS